MLATLVVVLNFVVAQPAEAVLTSAEKNVIAALEVSVKDAGALVRASTSAIAIIALAEGVRLLQRATVMFFGSTIGGLTQPERVASAYGEIDNAIAQFATVSGASRIVTRLQAIDRTLTFSAWTGTWYPNIFNQAIPPRPIGEWDRARRQLGQIAGYASLACQKSLSVSNVLTGCYELSKAWEKAMEVIRVVIAEVDGPPDAPTILRKLRLLLVKGAQNLGDAVEQLAQNNQLSFEVSIDISTTWTSLDEAAWAIQTHKDIFGPGT